MLPVLRDESAHIFRVALAGYPSTERLHEDYPFPFTLDLFWQVLCLLIAEVIHIAPIRHLAACIKISALLLATVSLKVLRRI